MELSFGAGKNAPSTWAKSGCAIQSALVIVD